MNTEPTQGLLSDRRPKIELPGDNRLLSDFGSEIGKAIAPENIFVRRGMAVTINDRGDGLTLMTPDTLRSWLEQYAVCFKVRKVGNGEASFQFRRTMTQTDAAGVLASPQFIGQLRPIERFSPVPMPVMRKSGWIELLPSGYDAESQTFTMSSSVPVLKLSPDMAREIIYNLLSEFNFKDTGRSRSVAVAAMFTVFGIGLLPPGALRPVFIYLANGEGAGKTLLVKCATVPVLGSAPTSTKPGDEAEMRKILDSAVLEAKPVIFLDNFKGHLSSESLECFASAQEVGGRILGQSKLFTGPNNATVFVTGNGATVSPDMRRRSLFVELHLEAERAEDRVFKQRLEVPELLERRSDILSALWTLILDWHEAMQPKPSRSHSGCPQWADIIGGIVENAGFGCPLETPKIEAAADTDSADMRALVAAVANGSAVKEVDFPVLVDIAQSGGLFPNIIPEHGELEPQSRARMAAILKRYDGRLVGDCRFRLLGKGRNRSFQVERIGGQNP